MRRYQVNLGLASGNSHIAHLDSSSEKQNLFSAPVSTGMKAEVEERQKKERNSGLSRDCDVDMDDTIM